MLGTNRGAHATAPQTSRYAISYRLSDARKPETRERHHSSRSAQRCAQADRGG